MSEKSIIANVLDDVWERGYLDAQKGNPPEGWVRVPSLMILKAGLAAIIQEYLDGYRTYQRESTEYV